MDLKDYLRVLRRHWSIVTALTLAGLLAGGIASVLVKPTYTAEAQLFVAIQNSGTVQELQQGNTFSQARVQSYVKTVETPVVLQPAIDALGLSQTSDQLAAKVRASTDLNTVLIKISADDESPVQAAAIAQAVSTSLIKAVDTLERPKNGGPSPVGLSIIRPAQAPSSASAPNTRLNLLSGVIIGLLLGLVAAVLKSILDNRVRGEADLRLVTEAPVLGGIAFGAEAVSNPLITQIPAQSPRAESFRQLRTNLGFANVAGNANSILITSSLPGEGKSTTAANLAIALSQAGHRVCLVDADLRRPSIDAYLGLERSIGLTTVLIGAVVFDEVLQPWGEDDLYVLTAGQLPPNPSELLGSAAMSELIHALESSFDMVIIDAPPLLPVTDAAVLSSRVGGVVLVVGSQRVRRPELERSLKALDLVDANLLGVVLNRIPSKGPDAYAYNYYSYASDSSNESKRSKSSKVRQTQSRHTSPLGTLPSRGEEDRAFNATSATDAPSTFPRRRVESYEADRQ